MSPLPPSPWQHLSMDFCGPLPTGEMLMVVIDDYTRYPVVEVINSTSANTVIATLDRILSLFSIPTEIRTDNGPPFNSEQFKQYATLMGFHHRRVTPLFPQADGHVERFMRTLVKALQIAKIEGKNWRQELQIFLRAYRTTAHCSTKIAPSELLFNRKVRTKLPEYQLPGDDTNTPLRIQDDKAKHKMKMYADMRNNAKPSDLLIGDTVLVKQRKKDKLSSYFDPTPYRIIDKKGSMVTAARGDHSITRNSSFYKRINPTTKTIATRKDNRESRESEQSEDDDDEVLPQPEIQRQLQRQLTPARQPVGHGQIAQQQTTPRPQRQRHMPRRLQDFVVKYN